MITKIMNYFPANIIYFKPHEHLEHISVKRNEVLLFEDTLDSDFKVKINLCYLTDEEIQRLQSMFPVTKFNVYFKAQINYEDVISADFSKRLMDLMFKLKKMCFFALSLSILNENKFYRPTQHNCEYLLDADNLQGMFLPFKFLAFEGDFRHFNAYYVASDYREYNHCIGLEDKNINDIKEILKKILIENKNIAESSMELFLQLHTLDWVKEGFFYSSLILVYTLWSNIVFLLGNDINRINTDLRIKMQRARNVIAHPIGENKHFERLNGKEYYFKNGPNDAILTIHDLEEVRQEVIKLIRSYLGIY